MIIGEPVTGGGGLWVISGSTFIVELISGNLGTGIVIDARTVICAVC